MPNGKKGDHPLTDITHWKIPRFSPKADGLISEIIQLGGTAELERTFDLFAPPPIPEFEASLQAMRDRLYHDAKERGWEVLVFEYVTSLSAHQFPGGYAPLVDQRLFTAHTVATFFGT